MTHTIVMASGYESIAGFFLQDEETGCPAVPPSFGLKDASGDRWSKFRQSLISLNRSAEYEYKFILLSRHGEGYHNVGEAKYGSEAWDDYWSKLDGDGELVWGPDPQLTPLGVQQAHEIRKIWTLEALAGLPAPDQRYCSPLTRALNTCEIQFDGSFPGHRSPVMILENCREENGVHTCDKRNTRSYISKSFPKFEIEDSLTELDELWDLLVRETHEAVAERAKSVLDFIFRNNPEALFISLTAHGGFINGVLNATGRDRYALPTGGVMPLVVRARRLKTQPASLVQRLLLTVGFTKQFVKSGASTLKI